MTAALAALAGSPLLLVSDPIVSDYSEVYAGRFLMLEGGIAAVIAVVFVAASFATLRERHRDVSAWHVHVGAGIYGAVFGVVIGFILVPIRLAMSVGRVPPGVTAWSAVGFFAVMFALRKGVLGRLPFLGPQVRAYRRASLRRAIELSQKELEKLSKKRPQERKGAPRSTMAEEAER